MSNCDFTPQLQELIQKVGISSLKALIRAAGVSERQLLRLRRGEVQQMRVDVLLKLSSVLKLSLSELIIKFSEQTISVETNAVKTNEAELLRKIADFLVLYVLLSETAITTIPAVVNSPAGILALVFHVVRTVVYP